MTDLYSASSSVSPLTAILWCFYPIAIIVIIELFLGGGFDDDNNDDQDGGMLIPAYSRSNAWIFWSLNYNLKKIFSKLTNNIDTTIISLTTLIILIITSLSLLVLRTLKEGRKALTEINEDRSKLPQKSLKI